MKAIAIVLLALSPAAVWKSLWKDTNSYAAAQRGTKQYATKRYDQSVKSFGEADRLASSSKSAFNLGTAQIADDKMTDGSATLTRAMKDPALRADSFFNRGNSALKSKAYEYAIRDYVETLKLRPADAGAKRNLEIALEQLQTQRKSAGGKQGPQQPSPSQQQGQKSPSAGQKEDQQQQSDAESLLRSVQQQEQEELQRMKRARGESVRVGW
jgi:Ca-activated chloride channel homolog